jgi:hypothetical protein
MNKEYCPQCGDDRYLKGNKCVVCDFPDCYQTDDISDLFLDLWEIEASSVINSNEYEEFKNS